MTAHRMAFIRIEGLDTSRQVSRLMTAAANGADPQVISDRPVDRYLPCWSPDDMLDRGHVVLDGGLAAGRRPGRCRWLGGRRDPRARRGIPLPAPGSASRPEPSRLERLADDAAPSATQRLLDGPDRQRAQVDRGPEIAVASYASGVRNHSPRSYVTSAAPRAVSQPSSSEAAADHECRERIGRPDPDLGRLLARRVHRAVGAHPIDRAHPSAAETPHVVRVDRAQSGLDPIGR